jgi:hypothetical protein
MSGSHRLTVMKFEQAAETDCSPKHLCHSALVLSFFIIILLTIHNSEYLLLFK